MMLSHSLRCLLWICLSRGRSRLWAYLSTRVQPHQQPFCGLLKPDRGCADEVKAGVKLSACSGRSLETRFCLTVETTHVRHKGKWIACAPECCNYVVLDNDAQHIFYNKPAKRRQGRGGRHAVQVTRGGATRMRATLPSSLGLTPVFLSWSPLVDDLDGELQCFVKLFLHICVCITNKSAP